MRHKQIEISILLALGLWLSACKRELNVFPANANVDGNLVTDQQTAQRLLIGVYARFANVGSSALGNLNTQWTDVFEYIPSEMAGTMNRGGFVDSIADMNFSPSYFLLEPIWQYGYNLVNAANGFIKNAGPVGNIPAAVKQRMLAEARFLRAFGNASLLFYFGQYRDPSSKYGIILRDSFVTATSVNLPRSGVSAAYASILSDLDIAISGCPSVNSEIFFTNAWVAKLMKARVLMNRAAGGDYAEVISLTKDIIDNGPFILEDSVKDIFRTKGFSSKEVMMGIQPYSDEHYKWTNYYWYPSDSLMSLVADDTRNQWLYMIDSGGYTPALKLTKYAALPADFWQPPPLSQNCYAFRLSEAYLLEAEALALSGGDMAASRALLKTVMLHAGAGLSELTAVDDALTPEALQLEIVKENMRNFIYENGVDWLALRRLPFVTIQRLNPLIPNENRLILPIPTAELKFNNVIQNPGY